MKNKDVQFCWGMAVIVFNLYTFNIGNHLTAFITAIAFSVILIFHSHKMHTLFDQARELDEFTLAEIEKLQQQLRDLRNKHVS